MPKSRHIQLLWSAYLLFVRAQRREGKEKWREIEKGERPTQVEATVEWSLQEGNSYVMFLQDLWRLLVKMVLRQQALLRSLSLW